MKTLLILISVLTLTCASAQKAINLYPADTAVNDTADQLLINKYVQTDRYQVYRISPKFLLANLDSTKQNLLYKGQDSLRVTVNTDTVQTAEADSLNSYIYLTPYISNTSPYITAIHTGHYFVIKGTWAKGNRFNWLIIKK